MRHRNADGLQALLVRGASDRAREAPILAPSMAPAGVSLQGLARSLLNSRLQLGTAYCTTPEIRGTAKAAGAGAGRGQGEKKFPSSFRQSSSAVLSSSRTSTLQLAAALGPAALAALAAATARVLAADARAYE